MTNQHDFDQLSRRAFLGSGSLLLATTVLDQADARTLLADDVKTAESKLRFGLVTDLHYADKDAAGTRFYRDSLDKLTEAAKAYGKEALQFVVELGDLIDAAATVEEELSYLKRIDQAFSAISKDRHYVLGNHCVTTLSKQEFLGGVGREKSYYSFDVGDHHFIVLDACFLGDGQPYHRKNFEWDNANIPPAEIDWLREDLKQTPHKTIIFAHQRLDNAKQHGVKNGPEVRRVLEESGKVLAVFQGHSHQNDHQEHGGIHYCTLRAMVEGAGVPNNAFTAIDILPGNALRVNGFQKQKSYDLE